MFGVKKYYERGQLIGENGNVAKLLNGNYAVDIEKVPQYKSICQKSNRINKDAKIFYSDNIFFLTKNVDGKFVTRLAGLCRTQTGEAIFRFYTKKYYVSQSDKAFVCSYINEKTILEFKKLSDEGWFHEKYEFVLPAIKKSMEKMLQPNEKVSFRDIKMVEVGMNLINYAFHLQAQANAELEKNAELNAEMEEAYYDEVMKM